MTASFVSVSMKRRRSSRLAMSACAALLIGGSAKAAAPDGLTADDLSALEWREVGTAAPSGRIARFAVHPDDDRVIYVASASGGLWKTINGGTSWEPIFENQSTVSMGEVTLDPNDPDTVWVGTGEQNSVRSSQFGDGVYRSKDGGQTWEHMGLEGSRHVGRIIVHPDDSDVVYVAALGSLWGPNEERGLYRSKDGGESWERLLRPSEYTGVVEVAMHPDNPDILYAATFQRERRQWSMVGGGEEAGLWRSEDGGDSWARVSNGFPTTAVGRVGVTFCESDPDTIYATAVGPDGGTFRSIDGGESWERRNSEVQSHWYYGEVFCDPQNPERVYVPVTPLLRSDDGGETFENIIEGQVHADNHTLWINPDDPEHLMVGNDGGVYISRDDGKRWTWQSNLPVMQLYTVAVDMQEPFYHVYGGTQDNGSWSGPIGTRYEDGIANEDWMFISSGDGFYAVADPTDSDIIYSQSQYGVLYRTDRQSLAQKRIQPWQPQDGEFPPYRWNWSAPLVISPHDPETLYFAANVVFKSTDRGDNWDRISPDLTRQISRDELPLQDEVQPSDAIDLHASTALYGNIHSLAESPLKRGLLVAGTDDGVIQVSRDDGRSWEETRSFPGVPDMMKVGAVTWSPTEEGGLYAVFDGHKDNDFSPYAVRSDDYGETWENITNDLPEFGPTRSIAAHPEDGGLIFVGTDFGVYFSRDGGEHWTALRSSLPTNSVQGILVHPRENDLVIGTHGRGFWVLDDIGLLTELTPAVVNGHSHLATPRRATQIRDVRRGRRNFGHTYYTTENPPRGAIIDYWIGEDAVGESVTADILDEDGNLVRTVSTSKAERGAGRVVWDLRYEAPPTDSESSWRTPEGRFVMPGSYEVRLTVGDEVHTAPLEVRLDPAVDVRRRDRAKLEDLLSVQADLVETTYHANEVLQETMTQLGTVRDRLDEEGASEDLHESAQSLAEIAQRLDIALNGEDLGIAQQETVLPLSELTLRLYMTTEGYTGAPGEAQMALTEKAEGDVEALLADMQAFLSDDLPAFADRLAEAGIAWPSDDLPGMPSGASGPGRR